jgi:hypothetical protein
LVDRKCNDWPPRVPLFDYALEGGHHFGKLSIGIKSC